MIVRVKPLGHLHRGCGIGAARHREIRGEINVAGRRAVALRNRTDHRTDIKHLIVKRKITDGHGVQPGLALHLPMARAQLAAGRRELLRVDVALPKRLKCLLEFALCANARKTEIMSYSQRALSF
jgi:hypothetical protein